MATATLLNPAPHYHQPQHHSYSSNYPHSTTGSSMPVIMSPVEPRRSHHDDNESHRQSLPSIQEVIGSKPPTSAFAPSIPTSVSRAPSLHSPFTTSASSRPFPDLSSPQARHSSPRTLHNPTSFPARGEPMPPFADPARPALSARPPPPPPVNTYHPGPRPSPPPLKMETHMGDRQAEAHRANGYPHSAVSEPASLPYPPQPVQLPPGQLPLSGHPMSPRYGSSGPSLPSPFEGSRSSIHEDGEYAMRRPENKYEQTLSRHFEAWQYQESLAKVCVFSSSLTHTVLEPETDMNKPDCFWLTDDFQLCRRLRSMCRRGARPGLAHAHPAAVRAGDRRHAEHGRVDERDVGQLADDGATQHGHERPGPGGEPRQRPV